MALGALRGSRPAALALVALGAAALFVTLALDLPDARASGRLPESMSFEDAQTRPARGLYLAAAGGGLLVMAGFLIPAEGVRVRVPRPRRPRPRHRPPAEEESE